VTTALGQLIARGDIERRSDGAWILRGQPPEPRVAAGGGTTLRVRRGVSV
jgi:hypothetical protein